MGQKLIVIDSIQGIKDLLCYLEDKDFIVFDCETTGVTRQDQIIGFSICTDDKQAFYIIMAKWNKELTCLDSMDSAYKDLAIDILKLLAHPSKQLIMHNGVFDCYMVESNFKISLIDNLHTDTMILAHLLDENRRKGLKDLASVIFGEEATEEQALMKQSVLDNGGHLTKTNYEMYKADAYLMAKYGAKDALLTFRLWQHLVPELFDQGLDRFFYEEESMPLLKGPTYQLNTIGLEVDTTRLLSLKKQLEAECLEARDFIYDEIKVNIQDKYPGTNKKNTFNIGSSQQLSWLLFEKLGLEFATLTKGGKAVCKFLGTKPPYTFSAKKQFIYECQTSQIPKYQNPWKFIACDKKTLQKFSNKYKWIERLLEYQRKLKILNTYVEGIEQRTKYGIINPQFLQSGTTSGRYSSRNPNFQNLPRDDKRIKECIVARKGKIFVGADYSQLEPRVFAYFSNDQRLLAAFSGQDDFYSVIGMEVYGKTDCIPRKDGSPDAFGVKYKKLRDLSKIIALASTYGATAHQLAPTTGKSIDETQQDIDNYFESFPGVAKFMLDAHEEAKKEGQVFSLFGRPRRMPEATKINKLYGNATHSELPYEIRNILNLAVNHKVQSTGASIVNRAAIKFYENCNLANINAKLVCQVHDSLVVECDEGDADIVNLLLRDAMESTITLNGINLEAIPKIGKNLAEV